MKTQLKLNVEQPKQYTPTDFESDQEVRWCPGCGDYAILKAVQKVLSQLDTPKENHVFVSGIGCSSRFPYYLNTYGFHTIHGRAPCIATGVKLANPDLQVWLVTGDGDGFSIGTNHLVHLMRRNLNVKVLLFNNQIYGLTKGQYSPTSQTGLRTKSSPYGAIETPLDPIKMALAANCSFIARGIDVDSVGLPEILLKAAAHQGTCFIEIYQNCHVYNDGAFDAIRDKGARDHNTITLTSGQPLLFGKDKKKGLILKDAGSKEGGIEIKTIETDQDLTQITIYQSNLAMAIQMASMQNPTFPVPIGVFYEEKRAVFDQQIQQHIHQAKQEKKTDFTEILHQGHTWDVL